MHRRRRALAAARRAQREAALERQRSALGIARLRHRAGRDCLQLHHVDWLAARARNDQGQAMRVGLTMRRVAVVGAGMAGVSCAARLAAADCEVLLFEQARHVGGRMATRVETWIDPQGVPHQAAFDHGAPAFTAHSPAFRRAVDDAAAKGWVAPWSRRIAPGSFSALHPETLWVAVPRMPRWCEQLASGLPLATGRAIDGLERDGATWRLHCGDETIADRFSQVVLAIPPELAGPLLQGQHNDWAVLAHRWAMRPCWTLSGVAANPPPWDVARPERGPLAWLIRNDSKPGRSADAGCAYWVAQATWLYRWRFASAPRGSAVAGRKFWYDPALGLAVCGDFVGGAGVEGAWLSRS